jgi:hypothetical protein
MLFPSSLVADENIMIRVRQPASTSFSPDRINSAEIPQKFGTCLSDDSSTALICCLWAPECSATLRAMNSWDWFPAMPVKLKLSAGAF